MKRLLLTLLFLLASAAASLAKDSAQGYCEEGNRPVITSGLTSTTRVQASHPSCIITVYIHGAGLATIFSDNNGTPLANPFTGRSNGQWQFYAANGRYDVTLSSAGFSQLVTYSDILLCDPFEVGSTCNNGGATTAHNLLSTTHLDTVPESPPVRGDLITGQNQTSPTGVNPAWAALPIGTNGQVLTSTGVDAVWATPAGGSGCTLPGIDTAVLSEHPAGTCYDSLHWTWDDGTNKQNMLLGDGTNSIGASASKLTFSIGTGNGIVFGLGGTITNSYMIGDANAVIPAAANQSEFYVFGTNNIATHMGGLSWLIGDTNSAVDLVDPGGHHTQIYTFGRNNSVVSATAGTAVNAADCNLIGESNAVRVTPGAGGVGGCILNGFSNQLTTSGSGTYSNIALYGESNVLTGTVNGIQRTNILGNSNTVEDTLALSDQVAIVGDSNDVNGSISTVQILGYKNLARNVSAQNSVTVNTTLVGAANNADNTGASGTIAYQGTFGASTNLQGCTNCWIIGSGPSLASSNEMDIGMSTAAELTVTQGNVRRAPVGKTNGPVINALRTSGGTVTGTVGQTCNVAFTGGTGSGGTAVLYLITANTTAGALLLISAGGSYTLAPTGGTLTNGTATCSSTIVATTVIGLLPTCNAANEGSFSAVVDSTTATWGATISGGGANHVMGYCDGTNWTVMGS